MLTRLKNTGTVAVAIVLLLIIAAIILSIARYFWVDSAKEHFDELISVYIEERQDLNPEEQDRLKSQLLEGGMFIKMHRWGRESFIKDTKLYDDMILARDQRQMRRDKENKSVAEIMINL